MKSDRQHLAKIFKSRRTLSVHPLSSVLLTSSPNSTWHHFPGHQDNTQVCESGGSGSSSSSSTSSRSLSVESLEGIWARVF
ncbi:hypothetical protein E2C01_101431 [Portunus trituberculatus]|uniref:Uncharacterized protein n=1 Tax=Portunus trituberculatus TaxID=210409 RepID=A0A5B7KAQ2_PORTR|nr:hypothetical protein [Portunus trituberculatus]